MEARWWAAQGNRAPISRLAWAQRWPRNPLPKASDSGPLLTTHHPKDLCPRQHSADGCENDAVSSMNVTSWMLAPQP